MLVVIIVASAFHQWCCYFCQPLNLTDTLLCSTQSTAGVVITWSFVYCQLSWWHVFVTQTYYSWKRSVIVSLCLTPQLFSNFSAGFSVASLINFYLRFCNLWLIWLELIVDYVLSVFPHILVLQLRNWQLVWWEIWWAISHQLAIEKPDLR